MPNLIPTLNDVKSLDGRIYALLSTDEVRVLDFYLTQGRNFDVLVSIVNEADPVELVAARSQNEAVDIKKRANSRVSVTIGPAAELEWAARA